MEKEVVLIYQMGKVGSSSIYQSLKKYDQFEVYHLHTLSDELIQSQEKRAKKNNLVVEKHLSDSRTVLAKYFDSNIRPKRKIKIISMVREPVGRNISAYFQNLDIFHANNEKFKETYVISEKGLEDLIKTNLPIKILNYLVSIRSKSFSAKQKLIEDIKSNVPDSIDVKKYESRILRAFNLLEEKYQDLIIDFLNNYNHNVPLNWFGREYGKVLRINIYETKFPRLKGFLQLDNDNISCLIMKIDLPDSKKTRLINEFLGVDFVRIRNTNLGVDKYYGDSYTKFKDNIILPNQYLLKMINSKYTKYFYNPKERAKILQKWLKTKNKEITN